MDRTLETPSILPVHLGGADRPWAALDAKRSDSNVR